MTRAWDKEDVPWRFLSTPDDDTVIKCLDGLKSLNEGTGANRGSVNDFYARREKGVLSSIQSFSRQKWKTSACNNLIMVD